MIGKTLIIIALLICEVHVRDINRFNLKQVVILSRHGIRTPLVSNNMEKYTPKKWPEWIEPASYLTQKGAKLEGFMGNYFLEWLKTEGLLPSICLKRDGAFIYANSVQRTKESAKSFVNAAFKNCNITVYHKDLDPADMDPMFHPIIHNSSREFQMSVVEDMRKRLDKADLNEAFAAVDDILDIQNSEACKNEGICTLVGGEHDIIVQTDSEPNLTGPLSIANRVLDYILMSYYAGNDMKDVAWGKITDDAKFKLISKITKENQNVRFNSALIGRDAVRPLMQLMFSVFENSRTKFAYFAGHDSNISALLAVLGVKEYVLENSLENTPVGGKIVFQRWQDVKLNKDLLKIEYVYQSTEQLRNGTYLSLKHPPQVQTLELNGCSINENGFCEFADFVKILVSENLYLPWRTPVIR